MRDTATLLNSQRDHEQSHGDLSARPKLDPDVVIHSDVNVDIDTDRPEKSAPRTNSDLILIELNNDFIDKIKDVLIPLNSLLITLDVESMYTNILHEKGLESITERFKSSYLDENVLELLELCLNSNDFEFDGKWFLQNSGHKVVSTLCRDIYMAYFEEKALEKCPHKPSIYLRYLDDIFIISHYGRTVFSEFLIYLWTTARASRCPSIGQISHTYGGNPSKVGLGRHPSIGQG